MAAPSSTVWGTAVSDSEGDEGKIGIYTSVSTTTTTATVTIKVYFWSEYSVTDSNNTFYFNNEATSATTSKGAVTISHTVDSSWSTSNQTLLGTYTYTYDRGSSSVTKNCAAKLTNIEAVASKTMTVSTSYTIPAISSYVISYNANGGSGSMSSHTVTTGSSCTIKSNTFTRSGYIFAGWSTKSDNTDDGYNWTDWSGTWNYTNGQYGITDYQLVLYARWTARPSQSVYICDDGTVYARGYFDSSSIYIDSTGAIYAPSFTTGTSFYISSSGVTAKAFKEGTP